MGQVGAAILRRAIGEVYSAQLESMADPGGEVFRALLALDGAYLKMSRGGSRGEFAEAETMEDSAVRSLELLGFFGGSRVFGSGKREKKGTDR